MRQRAMIAQAIALCPKLIIADEPTSNLDVTIQARIIELFQKLKNEMEISILLITHDLGLVRFMADEVVVMDMEAGIEHLGRGTARGVDTLIVVVEPGQRSIDSAKRIIALSADIGLTRIQFVANKVTNPQDGQFISDSLNTPLLGSISYCEELRQSDRSGKSVLDGLKPDTVAEFERILDKLII